jgi:hypothetical protein
METKPKGDAAMTKASRKARRGLKVAILIAIAVLATPQLASAVITFDQLGDDLFIVSHRVKLKFWMSRGKAMRMVYEKTASLCLAAGYTHFEILQQESEANQLYDDANASLRVRYFSSNGAGRIDCRRNASDRYVEQASVKLARRGYRPPAEQAAPSSGSGGGSNGS